MQKPAPTSKPRAPKQAGEMRVYGMNACSALWQNRADAIIRVYVTKDRMREFAPLLKWCAKQKKAYHVLTDTELATIAQSVHHEGVLILALAPQRLDAATLLSRLELQRGPQCLVYLDGVQNPHNLGAIARVAAHFGVAYLLGDSRHLPKLTAAGTRIAEGSMEHVHFVGLDEPSATFAALRERGFKIVGTSSHGGDSLYAAALPERSVLVFGGEVEGASAQLLRAADEVRVIPGSGAVESLNVSVAAGLCLGEHWRLYGKTAAARSARE